MLSLWLLANGTGAPEGRPINRTVLNKPIVVKRQWKLKYKACLVGIKSREP